VFESEKQISALINKFEVKHKYAIDHNNIKNKGWISTYFNGYKNKEGQINQISVITDLCNLGADKIILNLGKRCNLAS